VQPEARAQVEETQLNTLMVCTAKTQYQKFKTNIPRKGIARPQSQFPHSCVCERFIYSQDRSAYIVAGKYVDRSWEYIHRSQTRKCGNWDRGRAIPFLGIHKRDSRCSVRTAMPVISAEAQTPSAPYWGRTGLPAVKDYRQKGEQHKIINRKNGK
jgi:hypothetical protein